MERENKIMNIEFSVSLIKKLVSLGVQTFCFCPGGRSAPFLEVLAKAQGLTCFSFLDERSCCFFALGQVRKSGRPVAVVTTSGTAVAELTPGVIEAYYSGLPLVLLTADRPQKSREQGAPQTLKNPTHLFKDYVYCSLDTFPQKEFNFKDWTPQKGSLHLNISFAEPLLDQELASLNFSDQTQKSISIYPDSSLGHLSDLDSFFKQSKNPMILVGALHREERKLVETFLKSYQGPFYLEALSGLQHLKNRLHSGECILRYGWEHREWDGLIRLGGVPRCRFWRDLDSLEFPVLNLSSPPFHSGLSRKTFHVSLWDHLNHLKKYPFYNKTWGRSLKEKDREVSEKWKKILLEYPKSEESWIARLKQSIPPESQVFLGNSLPIRLWDQVSFLSHQSLNVVGQSGVNGIDGLVSRFLGECETSKNNFALLGDLSFLYDSTAFWITPQTSPWTLFVINNFGGQIFSRLFKNNIFINSHKMSFEWIAKMWNLNYSLIKDPQSFTCPSNKSHNLVEICPSLKETQDLFQKSVSF